MNSFTKRLTACVIALLLILPTLVSCKGDKRKITEDGIVLLNDPVIIAGGDEDYKIAKPQASGDTYSVCLAALQKMDNGFSLSCHVAKEEDNGSDMAEILLGNTCRTETKEAMNAIGYDDFSITYVNKKIVIAAHTPQRLEEATRFLIEKLLQVKDGRLEYIGDYHFKSDVELMIGEGVSLSDYRIVCGDMESLYIAAQTLKVQLKKLCGVELEVIYARQPKEGREIVIGRAEGRDISARTDNLGVGEGLIAVENGDLLIAAKESTSATAMFNIFMEEYVSGTYTDSLNFTADFSRTENALEGLFKDDAARAAGTEIRVMSFNLLVDIWSTSPAVQGRDTTVAQTILNYTPDVIGFQEASATWQRNLKILLKETPYKLICTEQSISHEKYGKTCFTPILYNSEVLTLLDSDIQAYASRSNQYLRTMSWAYFEHNVSGERFIILNTHFEAPGNDAEEKAKNLEFRKKQAVELNAMIDELETQYNCPIVATGDFNTTEGNDKTNTHLPYWSLIDGGLHEAKYTADKIRRKCSTWHDLGSQISTADAGSFDHIFGTERVHFAYFNTLVDKILMSASDHCPIYADVKLN